MIGRIDSQQTQQKNIPPFHHMTSPPHDALSTEHNNLMQIMVSLSVICLNTKFKKDALINHDLVLWVDI